MQKGRSILIYVPKAQRLNSRSLMAYLEDDNRINPLDVDNFM